MKTKIPFALLAGLAIPMLCQTVAIAHGTSYYKVLSSPTVLTSQTDIVPQELALSYPVVIERSSTMSAVIEGRSRPILVEETTALPVTLERTTIAKPHHWPLSFGVWP